MTGLELHINNRSYLFCTATSDLTGNICNSFGYRGDLTKCSAVHADVLRVC